MSKYKGFGKALPVMSSEQFWKEDKYYLDKKSKEGNTTIRFWLYKNVVYTNDGDEIFKATECERYKIHKEIIDVAVADLKDKQDGVWYYSEKDGWYRKPLTKEAATTFILLLG